MGAPLDEDLFIAGDYVLVRFALVKKVGWVAAIVLQTIHYRCRLEKYKGGFPATRAELAEETGLGDWQIREATKKLRELGYLEGTRAEPNDPTLTWRVVVQNHRHEKYETTVTEKYETTVTSPSMKNKEEQPPEDYVLAAFEAVWKLWPRKVDKASALKAFRSAVRKAHFSTISAAISSHADIYRTWPRNRASYIPHLSTWLNKERWADEALPEPWRDDAPPKQRSRVYDSDMEPYQGDPDDTEGWHAHREAERERVWRERGEL